MLAMALHLSSSPLRGKHTVGYHYGCFIVVIFTDATDAAVARTLESENPICLQLLHMCFTSDQTLAVLGA